MMNDGKEANGVRKTKSWNDVKHPQNPEIPTMNDKTSSLSQRKRVVDKDPHVGGKTAKKRRHSN